MFWSNVQIYFSDIDNVDERPPEDITALHTIHEENISNHSTIGSDNPSDNHIPTLPTRIPVLIWIMGKKNIEYESLSKVSVL